MLTYFNKPKIAKTLICANFVAVVKKNTMQVDIRELNEKIQRESAFVDVLSNEMNKVIV